MTAGRCSAWAGSAIGSLQVIRFETSLPGDARKHTRTDLDAVVKRKNVVGPAGAPRTRCEPPDSRLMDQPILRRAANTRLALAAPHWLIPLPKRLLRVPGAFRRAQGGRQEPSKRAPRLGQLLQYDECRMLMHPGSVGSRQSSVHRFLVRFQPPKSSCECLCERWESKMPIAFRFFAEGLQRLDKMILQDHAQAAQSRSTGILACDRPLASFQLAQSPSKPPRSLPASPR